MPNETDNNPKDVDPRNSIFEQEYRYRKQYQRCHHIDQHCVDAQIPARTVDKQKSKLDTYDGDGKSDAGPVEFCKLSFDSACNGEEKESEQGNDEGHSIRDQQRNREVDIRRCALGGKVIERTGEDGEGNGEIKEEHGFFSH